MNFGGDIQASARRLLLLFHQVKMATRTHLLQVKLAEHAAAKIGKGLRWENRHRGARCLHDQLELLLATLKPDGLTRGNTIRRERGGVARGTMHC